jgi:HK97 gp10 family phage protein
MAPLHIEMTVALPDSPLLQAGAPRQVLEEEVGQALSVLVEELADQARRNTPVDRGILRGAIATELLRGPDAGILFRGRVFVGAQAPYGIFVEEGTRPHFPPVAPLEAWAKRKFGRPGLGYAVARAIARRGTKGHHMLRNAFEAMRPKVEPALARALSRAVRRLEGEG